jgi:hypothetical protein
VEGKEWNEWELISLLRALISALNTAERQGIALETVNPRALFQTSAGVKLFPSFGYMDAAYYSPERKQSQYPYNPFKSDVYSLGLTVLSLALGQGKLEALESVERDPRPVLEGLGGTIGQLLGWLLMGVEERPGFAQLEEYFQTNAGYFDNPANSHVIEVAEEQKAVEEQKVVEVAPREDEEMPITQTAQTQAVSVEVRTPTQIPVSTARPKPKAEAKQKSKTTIPCNVEERKEAISAPPQPLKCPVCFGSFYPQKKRPDSIYCSKKCRANKALRDPSPPSSSQSASLPIPKCDYCPAELNTTEKQELSCGHSFHNLNCLFTFLVAKSDNFTNQANYFCPKCNKRIKYRKEIEEAFGKFALQKRMEEARCALLCSQCKSAPFAYERRGKLLCAACSGQ